MKIWKFFFFLLLFMVFKISFSAAKILVVQQENWNHPVEKIFKKHGFSLYKVHYSKDGTCPTFYTKFPKNQNILDPQKIYWEILKANSYYPYAIVNKTTDLKINVGWADETKKHMAIDLDKASSLSICKGNNHAHIDDGADFDKFTINSKMAKRILNSPYHALMYNRDGKSFVAYLYAENISTALTKNYNCQSQKEEKSLEKTGHYYIYLYDLSSKQFFPGRIEVFKNYYKTTMNKTGTDFFAITLKNKSSLLLISQTRDCVGDDYEAYGFAKNQLFLKQYTFFTNKKHDQFLGRVNKKEELGKITATGKYNEKRGKIHLLPTDTSSQVQLQLVDTL